MSKNFKINSLFRKNTFYLLCSLFISLLIISGCASKDKEAAIPSNLSDNTSKAAINDPIEPLNRFVFGINMFLDTIAIEPLARGYRFAVPRPARNSVSNALSNLKSPVYFANQVMQGNVIGSGKTLARFAVNSTVGIAGLFDVADKMGLPLAKHDFGETLATWGSGEGFYLVLPLFGPSNLRDATGTAVDYVMDPFMWIAKNSSDSNAQTYGYIRTGLKVIDSREKMLDPIDEIKRSSVDLYAATRTMYRQNRTRQINKTFMELGKKIKKDASSSYDFDFPLED